MFRNHWSRALLILLVALLLGAYDVTADRRLPKFLQENCPAAESGDASMTRWFKERCLSLGLDLAGGTQLRYRVELGDIPEAQRTAVVDGIRQVFDRRVNTLGVSEPIVTPSMLNGQHYLTVELPGTKDIDDAIARVGKTVILEFKEQKTTLTEEEKQADASFNENKKTLAATTRERAKTEDFKALREEVSESFGGRGGEFKDRFREGGVEDSIPTDLAGALFDTLKPGETSDVIDVKIQAAGEDGQLQEVVAGYSIVKLNRREDKETKIFEPAKGTVTHLLVGYSGAVQADPSITRTKEEAKKRAEELLPRAKSGDFEKLIMDGSDDPSKTDNKGTFKDQLIGDADPTKNAFVKEFNDAVVAGKVGDIVGPVETAFGYHIIRIDAKTEKIDETQKRPQVDYEEIFFATRTPSAWRATGLTGGNLVRAVAQPVQNSLLGYEVSLVFDEEGKNLFSEITKRNINKPVGIYLDGNVISEPVVQQEISTGEAVITGNFSAKDATNLARDLNTGALEAPVKLVDQRQVEASLGGIALEDSMQAGLIGLVVLALFLTLYYRLPGLVASLALALYALLLLALFRLWPGYTLTLAGIAGTILSIGMATDANVLIFERMREELHSGKTLHLAIDHGFKRAWSSIRDSNFSSLITAAILTLIGTSVIRGFALTLAIGILASMFTALWVTRSLLLALMDTSLGTKPALWATLKSGTHRHIAYMAHRKPFYIVSALLFILAAIPIFTSGVRLGQEFTGGSATEVRFTGSVPSVEQIQQKLSEIGTVAPAPGILQNPSSAPAVQESSPYDGAVVIPSANGTVLLKTKQIDQAQYDRMVVKLAELNGGTPVEKVRFETTGPTIGEGLKKNTWKALFWAMVLMVLFIAFAFRRVPAVASPWKFGVTAVVALVHDIFIAIGFFVLMGRFFGWEIDTLFVTAMLTVFGFSVHDTIVVFDRIRENLLLHGREKSFTEIADDSLNQTIARSIITSVTTMTTLAAMALFGADMIRPFVVAMLFGIAIGTYSSIFVATPLLVDWQKRRFTKTRS